MILLLCDFKPLRNLIFKSLQAFMGSYAYWCVANWVSHHFKLYSQKLQQFTKQRSLFANDKEANIYKN